MNSSLNIINSTPWFSWSRKKQKKLRDVRTEKTNKYQVELIRRPNHIHSKTKLGHRKWKLDVKWVGEWTINLNKINNWYSFNRTLSYNYSCFTQPLTPTSKLSCQNNYSCFTKKPQRKIVTITHQISKAETEEVQEGPISAKILNYWSNKIPDTQKWEGTENNSWKLKKFWVIRLRWRSNPPLPQNLSLLYTQEHRQM